MAVVVVGAVAAVMLWTQRRDDATGPSPTWPGATSAATSAPGQLSPTPLVPNDAAFELARLQLTALAVHGWDRETDFKRYRFGKAWSDDVNVEFGHNGCNTRDDVLRRDLADLVVRSGTCYAQSGVPHDPYSGQTIDFVRGPDTSNAVEIDHVVSLADAWYKGARNWDDQRHLDFANDPRNLLAVSPKANFDKGFRDAAGWLPPDPAFGVPSSPGRSTSRRPISSGCRPTRSGRWPTS
jgi:hypothetical protein